jgi:predicted  nucleic acid-binding Zn-ribbon protein
MGQGCENCGANWPPRLLATVLLDGCPACRAEAWRAFGSGDDARPSLT